MSYEVGGATEVLTEPFIGILLYHLDFRGILISEDRSYSQLQKESSELSKRHIPSLFR